MSRPSIISPEEFLGFKVGEDRKLVNWDKIVEYFKLVSAASDRVNVEVLGKTTKGNDFILATVSSPETLKNLEKFREIQLKLHNPENLSDEEIDKLVEEGKTIVIVSCGIHSTEIAASQMSLELIYKLSTEDSDEVREILDNVILLFIPCLNPDGHIMVVNWYNKTLGTKYEGTYLPYMYHKYVGHDNNRDWFMLTQVENRLTVEKVHNRWHPQIVYDLHQMGSYGPRLWLPPFQDPIDPNVDPVLQQEITFMGSSMANELIGKGFKGVACFSIYDAWTPARAYQHYHGGIRILSEAASVKIATPLKIKAEELVDRRGLETSKQRWNNPHPWLGGEWHLRDLVDYELAAVMACLRNAAKYRRIWLRNTVSIFKRSLNPESGPFAFIISKDQKDLYNMYWLLNILKLGDVTIHKATKSFEADGIRYPEGTFIIYFAQPYGRYAKTLLEIQHYPDLRESPESPPKRPYDLTAWTLPLLMNVKVYTAKKPFEVDAVEVEKIVFPDGKIVGDPNSEYFVFSSQSNASYKLAFDLLREGFKVYRVPEELHIDDVQYSPGAFLVENSEGLVDHLKDALKNLPVTLKACCSIGKVTLKGLHLPSVGIYRSWYAIADEGWTRFLFEMFGVPYHNLYNNDIRQGNLKDKYDVIIIPSQRLDMILKGRSETEIFPEYAGGIGDVGVENLNDFVINGGHLVTLNQSCELPIKYMWIPVVNALEDLKPSEFYIPGSILRVIVDNSHPVGYGMDHDSAAMFILSPAFKAPEKYVVAKYPPVNPLLSGWILGEKYLHNLAAIVSIPKGKGIITLFGLPVQTRCQTPGTFKLLFNALLY